MWLRLLESLHGYAGALAVVALLHPAVLLRRGRALSRGLKWSVGLTSGFVALAFGLGIVIYEDYRSLVKRPLFAADRTAGMLFETKEHLAFAVVCLAFGGAACALLAPRQDRALRRLAAQLYAAAFVLGCVVGGLGTYIAAVRSF